MKHWIRDDNESTFTPHPHQRRLITFKFNVWLYKFKYLPAKYNSRNIKRRKPRVQIQQITV